MVVSIAQRVVVMEPSALCVVSFIRSDEHRWFGASRKSNTNRALTASSPTSMLMLVFVETTGGTVHLQRLFCATSRL